MSGRIFNAGIVGMGRLGRSASGGSALVRLPGKFKLAAVADILPERLENLPENYGNPAKFATLDEMIEKTDVEIVSILTRHRDHVPMAAKCLEAGRHVYLEKPCATSVREMEYLKSVIDKTGKKVFFGQVRRYESAFQKTLELLNKGEIGNVQFIKLDRAVGFRRRNDWLTMSEHFGGLLTNWGPHLIDQALMLLGAPVKDMWADVRRIVCIGDGDDFFKILLKAENGRTADVEVTGANVFQAHEMEIIGDRGTLVYPVDGKIWLKKIDPVIELKDLKPHPETPSLKYGNFDETLSFVESKYDVPEIPPSHIWELVYNELARGEKFQITYEQALNVVKITEEAFRISNFKPMKQFTSNNA